MKLFAFLLFVANSVVGQISFSGSVIDENKKPLAARIVIIDDTGHIYNSYYSKLPGFFTEEDGKFSISLQPGNYVVEIFHGIDYLSEKINIDLNKDFDTTILLLKWIRLKEEGWYNGDGHDHLYTDNKRDTAMLKLVRKICIAQGVDFMCTAQGWAGYNDSTWKEGYAPFSDDKFLLSYGSEMPKYRTGHTWWLGQSSTRGRFDETMDTIYENHYYQADTGTTWNFNSLPFPNTPDVEIVNRFKNEDHSIAVAAHPTSWWMQQRGSVEKYVTNVACNLPFSLLSGKIWDGLVAMGYNHDHYYYQNLWFNVLNLGYRMSAFSELDGGLGRDDKFYYGSMRTYFKVDGALSIDKIVKAGKKGASFLTSGPVIFADIDSRYNYGDVIRTDNKRHHLNIRAFASGDSDDFLSYVIVFRNGKVFKVWDVRKDQKRKFEGTLPIVEKERSWYIVKVYGKKAWADPKLIDVMGVCEGKYKAEEHGEFDVAFTNPFYFRSSIEKDPAVLQSNVNLLLESKRRIAINGVIDLLVAGKKIRSVKVSSGKISFKMPVNAVLNIRIHGFPEMQKSLYLDYIPHRNLIEELASGRWREREKIRYQPGEVPWKAFKFEKTKAILSNVNWTIRLD